MCALTTIWDQAELAISNKTKFDSMSFDDNRYEQENY